MIRRDLLRFLLVLILVLLGVSIQRVQARLLVIQEEDSVIRGAMLYDRWYAVLSVDAPNGNMPLWSEQSTNTRSGPETWRCVSCHGWDYQGREGAYRYGSNFTGFPGVFHAREKSSQEIVGALKGLNNPQHDFSPYMEDESLNDLAAFITSALIDDNEFIDPQSLAIKGGDADHGEQLYQETCAGCHGEDGKQTTFRFEGREAWLGTLAILDPWRFLHKTRYGTPGTQMPVGAALGWTPQDGRDVLFFARSFPTGLESQAQPPTIGSEATPQGRQPGGPATSIITGILTALGAMVTGVGFAILVGAALVGIILLLVWLLRGQNK